MDPLGVNRKSSTGTGLTRPSAEEVWMENSLQNFRIFITLLVHVGHLLLGTNDDLVIQCYEHP